MIKKEIILGGESRCVALLSIQNNIWGISKLWSRLLYVVHFHFEKHIPFDRNMPVITFLSIQLPNRTIQACTEGILFR